MWARLRRFSALPGPARLLFLRTAVLLLLVSLSLRWRGFSKTRASLQKRLPKDGSAPPRAAPDSGQIEWTVRMVRAASRCALFRVTCLQESLALWWLLARQGLLCEVRVGVRTHADKFEAHAWVEHAGVALNEPEALHAHYAAFDAALASVPLEPR